MLAPEDILRLEELIQDAIKDVPERKSVFVAADVMNVELRRLGFVRLTDEAIRKGLAAAAWATASMAFLDGVSADGPKMTAAKVEAFRRAVSSDDPKTWEANDGA